MGEEGNGSGSPENFKEKKKSKTPWLIGLAAAVALGTGVTMYQRAKDVVPPKAPEPVTYVLPSRDAVESKLREPGMNAGYVVQKGDTYASIGEKLYGSKEAGKRLQSINEYMGNVSMVRDSFVSDPVVDLNRDSKITRWEFARRSRTLVHVEWPALAPGDKLFTPKYITGFNGMSWEYSVPVSEQAIGGAYQRIEDRVTDSLGAGNVRFVIPFEEGVSGRRFDGDALF